MLHVCLVDDDHIFAFAATKMIESVHANVKLTVFSTAEVALANLRRLETNTEALPDIILLDINMPVMNGWEFLEAYTKLSCSKAKQCSIYIVSSSVREADLQKAREFPEVVDYIFKPVTKEHFRKLLLSDNKAMA